MTSEALTAERCAIVLDSTSDLPDCRERHANMRMVPLTVRFGDEELLDYEEITPQRFYERLAGDPQPPRTAAPPPERFAACYRELLEARRLRARALAAPLRGALGHGQLGAPGRGGVRRPRDRRRHAHGLDRPCARGARRRAAARRRALRAGRPGRRRPRASTAARASCSRSRRSSSSSATGASAAGRRSSAACSACGRCSRWSRARSSRSGACAATRACWPSSSGSSARTRAPDERLRVGVAHAQAESDRERHRRDRAQRPPAGRDRARGAARRRRRHEHRPGRRRTRVGARARLKARLKSVFAALQARPRLLAGLQIAAVAILLAFLGLRVQRRRARCLAAPAPRRPQARRGSRSSCWRSTTCSSCSAGRASCAPTGSGSATARCSARRCSRCSPSTSPAASGRRPRGSLRCGAPASTTPPWCWPRSCSRPASRPWPA